MWSGEDISEEDCCESGYSSVNTADNGLGGGGCASQGISRTGKQNVLLVLTIFLNKENSQKGRPWLTSSANTL